MGSKHQQVVVAYDFSDHGAAVLARAVALVSRAPFHILHFVTVIDPHSGVPGVPVQGTIDYRYADVVREALADEVRKAFGTTPISDEIHFFIHARMGKPAKEILGLAEEVGADLAIVGTHGHTGLQRLVMGSVAEKVVREAGCPVLVVRPKQFADIELDKVVHLEDHVPHRTKPHRFSYANNSVIMRPPEWPIS